MRTIILCAICLAGAAWAATASAADIVVSTGLRQGSYYGIGLRLRSMLAAEHETYIDVVESAGSIDNLERLDDPQSRVNVAFTQADALNHYLGSNPGFASEYILLGDVGRECAFIVARNGGPIAAAADLKKGAGQQMSVGDPRSGAAITYETMIRLEPRFGETSPVFVDMMESLLQIKVGSQFTSLRAAMFVQRPLRRSSAMQLVLDDPEAYRFVSIREQDLRNAELPDGSVVYTFEEVTVGGKSRSRPVAVETLCTRGFMLGAKPKLDAELRGLLSKVMLESGDRIIGDDE